MHAATNCFATRHASRLHSLHVLVVSGQVEPATRGSLTLTAASGHPSDAVVPRLRVRRVSTGVVELSLHGDPEDAARNARARMGTAALSRPWAWPLPHAPMSAWRRYEDVLREAMAATGVDMGRVMGEGLPLTLSSCSLQVGAHVRRAVMAWSQFYPMTCTTTVPLPRRPYAYRQFVQVCNPTSNCKHLTRHLTTTMPCASAGN